MNLVTMTNTEVYFYGGKNCIRYEKPDNEGPVYLPILPVGKGLELRRMEINTKIAVLAGEMVESTNEEYFAEIVVYNYLLQEELDQMRRGIEVILQETERGVEHEEQ